MESNNDKKDFEQFVKQNADQYRMFPSENVWKGIHTSLHTRRRWHNLGLGLLLILTGATVTWVMSIFPNKNEKSTQTAPLIAQNSAIIAEKKTEKPEPATPAALDFKTVISPTINAEPSEAEAIHTEITSLAAAEEKVETPAKPEELPAYLVSQKNELSSAVQNEWRPIDIAPAVKKDQTAFAPLDVRIIDQATDDNTPDTKLKAPISFEPEIASTETNFAPLGIESVLNTYKARRRKISWQVYLIPTISYRRLSENKGFLRSTQSNRPYSYASLHDVNSAVTHKPDMGVEFGMVGGYPVGKSLTIIAGLQFNVSKYDIRAYTYPSEVATIALSNGYGANSSVSLVSNYRNFGGYSSNWLHNLYFSVSVPFGAELRLIGSGKTYLGVSGTIQPTYVISDRAYIISTDYKNYVKVPSLIRTWNMNSSFETFAAYSTGKLKWKVGPQVRYQMLSSFQEKYPVREHLFDFGLKVGVMLNK